MNERSQINFFNDENHMRFKDECDQKYCDVHRVAFYLNVTPRRIQMLVKRRVLPRDERGKYELISCIHAYLIYLKKMINHFVVRFPRSGPRFLQSFEPPYDNYLYETAKKGNVSLFGEAERNHEQRQDVGKHNRKEIEVRNK